MPASLSKAAAVFLPGTHLPLVEYSLELGSGDGPFSEPPRLRDLVFEEGLDTIYALQATVLVRNDYVDARALVGTSASLRMTRGEVERVVHGIVLRASYAGTYGGVQHLQLHIGPALALLGLGARSRAFQDRTVVQIVEKVVEPAFGSLDRRLDVSLLQAKYEQRDYCVQWNESDLAFVQRILAEEGISFVFEHGEATETMILIDSPSTFAALGQSLLAGDGGSNPPVIALVGDHHHEAEVESVAYLDVARDASISVHRAHSWDWKHTVPSTFEGSHTAPNGEGAPFTWGEHYVFEPRRVPEGARSNEACIDETSRITSILQQGEEARAERGKGWGNVLAFAPGTTFELSGHPQHELDRGYVLVRVVHRADLPEADTAAGGGGGGHEPNYVNEFECAPIDAPLRPRLRPRPRAYGPLLATVVGPSGKEIHTDEHGRIRVLLHWDREGRELGADASCWVRVAQAFAGPGYGTLFIPRVGMEVVVSFLDGNPDRPLVSGCVYNGANPPPYTLPDERTKSTIKTSSSPGGRGFNELRFEDAADREEIFLHAQRDLVHQVRADHTTNVGANDTLTVEKDRTVTVRENQSVTVVKDRKLQVDGSVTETIGGLLSTTCAGDRKIEIKGAREEYVRCTGTDQCGGLPKRSYLHVEGQHVIEATDELQLIVGECSIVMTPRGITVKVPDTVAFEVGKDFTVCGDIVALTANRTLDATQGTASVRLSNNTMALGGVDVQVSADKAVTVSGTQSVTLEAAGKVEITGGLVSLN